MDKNKWILAAALELARLNNANFYNLSRREKENFQTWAETIADICFDQGYDPEEAVAEEMNCKSQLEGLFGVKN